MDDHYKSIFMYKTHSTKTLRQPINLAARKTLACIAGGFLVCFFFSCSQSKSYSCGTAELRQKQNRGGVRGQGSLPSPFPHSPIIFFPRFSFRMPETLTLPQQQKQKTHQKKLPATQATKTFFMLSTTCPKYIILLMIHITDENGRPYHLQNQYLPLLHNWTVCQRKNAPSWSMSML